jgi:hypothetical protein
MAEALAETAVAISITSFTDMVNKIIPLSIQIYLGTPNP